MLASKNIENKILLWTSVVGSILVCSLICGNNLWMDEAFSAVLVRGVSLSEVINASANDTLPPLYNILNWLATTVLGFKPWVLRLASCFPVVAVIVFAERKLKRIFGFETALSYIICMTGMPWILYYATEIRMYSLGMAFVTLAGLFSIEIYSYRLWEMKTRIPEWIGLIVCTLGAGYTHHFALVATGFIFLYLVVYIVLLKRELFKEWLIAAFVTAVGYLPCLFTTLKQMKRVNGYFTMPDVSAHFVMQCFKSPFTADLTVMSAALVALFVFTYVVVIIGMISGRTDKEGAVLSLLGPGTYCGVLAFGLLATKIFKANIFTDRYLYPCYGLLWLGFAIAFGIMLSVFEAPVVKKAVAYGILAFLALVVAQTYRVGFIREYDNRVNSMTSFFEQNMKENDQYIIYEDNYQIEICFRYYFPEFKKTTWDEAQNTLWYIAVPGYEDYLREIEEHGYKPQYIGDFNFDRYGFAVYRLEKDFNFS